MAYHLHDSPDMKYMTRHIFILMFASQVWLGSLLCIPIVFATEMPNTTNLAKDVNSTVEFQNDPEQKTDLDIADTPQDIDLVSDGSTPVENQNNAHQETTPDEIADEQNIGSEGSQKTAFTAPLQQNLKNAAPLSQTPTLEIENPVTEFQPENSPEPYLNAGELKNHLKNKRLKLRSAAALILDERDNVVLYERHADKSRPIASITKLMTAMVLIDAKLRWDESIIITREDHDHLRRSRSRLRFGTTLSRADMLLLALAASENRAASALARTYPGGKQAFVKAMNRKSKKLGLRNTKFLDSAGLQSGNVSTANELAILLETAFKYPLIRQMTTTKEGELFDLTSSRSIKFVNTNRLVRSENWDIDISKTGFISEAGFCLVMRTTVSNRPLTIILLNSWGKLSKYGDANRIKNWLISAEQKILGRKHNIVSSKSLF